MVEFPGCSLAIDSGAKEPGIVCLAPLYPFRLVKDGERTMMRGKGYMNAICSCGHQRCNLRVGYGSPILGIWDMSHSFAVPEMMQEGRSGR